MNMHAVRTTLLLFLSAAFLLPVARAQQTLVHYLSGTDKDHTVQWDFLFPKGRNGSPNWTRIAVPAHWEQQGFGNYEYGNFKDKWEEQGLYRHTFSASAAWQNKKVFLVFEGVMTDAEVNVNGRPAGEKHQGGFYRFQYDITDLLQYRDSNVLEVAVSKHSANAALERAERGGDFWALSGIYRPVYLKIVPGQYIDRVALDARANGALDLRVYTANTGRQHTIEAQLQDLQGNRIGLPLRAPAGDSALLKHQYPGIRSWNPEQPRLYELVISLKQGTQVVHSIRQRLGFRTAELRPRDGFYVNGVKVVLKGVNRHSAWPESGRTLSRAVHLLDIRLMKEMNMNAVRMSHYPPDPEFLDLCDSLGLFVLDELTGWQAAYDTVVGRKLVRELVLRDVNHPSVVMWANGNEGGWNRALDNDFHLYDPQRRLVYHPWEKFNGTDTKHYPDYSYVANSVLYGQEVYFPTEFMHGLHDGGHGAGLEDFWNRMLEHPHFGGGFLWSFADEGLVRMDKDSMIDIAGTNAPDGIVGPHRQKEGSYYAIRAIWSPVVVHNKVIPETFNGRFQVENRFLYTHLSDCAFSWKLVSFPGPRTAGTEARVLQSGMVKGPALAPGERGWLTLALPKDVPADALYLTALDAQKKEVCTWSWPLRRAVVPAAAASAAIGVREDDKTLALSADGITYHFDKATGYLQKVVNGTREIALHGGPALAGVQQTLTAFRHEQQGEAHVVEPQYRGEGSFFVKWTFRSGALPQLEYRYSVRGEKDFLGITFNYPEGQITGMKWLGRGPYRVWKNRLKGQQVGVWEKAYNNTVTGESWVYPEFKGWHADLQWVQVQNREAPFTVYAETPNLFLQMLRPARPAFATNENTTPLFPEGGIGFMHGISAIGTKFQPAGVMGPQSGKNTQLNYTPYSGLLRFDFR